MTNLSWQGRQRILISFEVETIVTSKAGQRMGLDWETMLHLDVLRNLKTFGLQLQAVEGMLCKADWAPQKDVREHPLPFTKWLLQAMLRLT